VGNKRKRIKRGKNWSIRGSVLRCEMTSLKTKAGSQNVKGKQRRNGETLWKEEARGRIEITADFSPSSS